MKNDCKSTQTTKGYGGRERPRFFPYQLISDEELTAGQEYFRNKLRLHNRMIHGWGVVCGALVCPKLDPDGNVQAWKVVLKPGYVLGPWGDDILIECDHEVDLRTAGSSSEWAAQGDPWCSEVYEKPQDGPRYLAVQYCQSPAHPVRVEPLGCGCDETRCEYARWKDGYKIGILDECPESHRNPPNEDSIIGGPNPECPPCPDSPWVVLACIEMGPEGMIERIDNCACRRVVVSYGNFWWKCQERDEQAEQVVQIDAVRPVEAIIQGATGFIEVTGRNLERLAPESVNLGAGVEVTQFRAQKELLRIDFKIAANAQIGQRQLKILLPDGTSITKEAFAVKQRPAPTEEKPPNALAAANDKKPGASGTRKKPSNRKPSSPKSEAGKGKGKKKDK